jgi:hypothetical protein
MLAISSPPAVVEAAGHEPGGSQSARFIAKQRCTRRKRPAPTARKEH